MRSCSGVSFCAICETPFRMLLEIWIYEDLVPNDSVLSTHKLLSAEPSNESDVAECLRSICSQSDNGEPKAMPNQLVSSGQLQKMQQPRHAALDFDFCEVQFVGDVAIV